MGFLYTNKFDIISHKTGETIIQIINRNTVPVTRDPFRIYSSNPYDNFLYYGKSYWNGFCVSPVSESFFQVYFPPNIIGVLDWKEHKTILHITMKLDRFAKIFLALITAGSLLFFLLLITVMKCDILLSIKLPAMVLAFHIIAQIIFRIQIKKYWLGYWNNFDI